METEQKSETTGAVLSPDSSLNGHLEQEILVEKAENTSALELTCSDGCRPLHDQSLSREQ